MSTPAWIKDILRGGIPELLDLGDVAPTGDENQDGSQTRPEQNAPSDLIGRESANPNFIGGFSQNQIVTVAVIGGGAWLLFKFIKSV